MKYLVFAALVVCVTGRSVEPGRLLSSLLKIGNTTQLLKGDRIVGGNEATPNEFPWQISLQRCGLLGGCSHSCGGSIYSSSYIIDAAHCVDDTTASSLRVVAGEHKLSQASSDEQIRQISSFKIHASWNPGTMENDIALLKLSEPLNMNSKVAAIPLPTQGQVTDPGTTCIVSGWGTTSSGSSSVSDVLRKVAVPIISDPDCLSMYGSRFKSTSMICAGFIAGSADSCQGDSGGPLATLNPNKLIGVVSWGNGCASPGKPGVYTRVANYVDWIKANAV